jgi:hypothetical protein
MWLTNKEIRGRQDRQDKQYMKITSKKLKKVGERTEMPNSKLIVERKSKEGSTSMN